MEKIHNTKDKILLLLLLNKKKEFTIRGISRKISIDYKSVYIIVNKLISDRIINARKIGQTILCSLNLKTFNDDLFRAEYIRRGELLKNKDFKAMNSYFEDIKNPFFILLLFGSYASGKVRKGSDIDLMLVTDDKKMKESIKNKISLIPLDIHLLDFNSKEFVSMLKTSEFNVGKEAFYNNIILFGIENYYELLKNIEVFQNA